MIDQAKRAATSSTERPARRLRKDASQEPRTKGRKRAFAGQPWLDRQRNHETPDDDLLTAEQERELAARIKAGDMEARDRLVLANLRLVGYVARFYSQSRVPVDDLVQEGNLGLIRAAELFDPTAHIVRFGTYATYWIRAFIHRALGEDTSIVRLPEYARLMRTRYLKLAVEVGDSDEFPACRDLLAQIDPADVARRLDVPVKKLRVLRQALLDRVYPMDFDRNFCHEASAVDRPLMDEENRAAVQKALAMLTPFEAWIVCSRYQIELDLKTPASLPVPMESDGCSPGAAQAAPRKISSGPVRTLKQLSLDCGLPVPRLRHIEKKAMAKLRGCLEPIAEPMPATRKATIRNAEKTVRIDGRKG